MYFGTCQMLHTKTRCTTRDAGTSNRAGHVAPTSSFTRLKYTKQFITQKKYWDRALTHVDGFDGNSRRAKLTSDVVVHRFAPSVDSQAGVTGLGEDAILLNGCWTRCNFLTLARIRRAASPMIVSAKKKGAALYEPTTRTGRTVA